MRTENIFFRRSIQIRGHEVVERLWPATKKRQTRFAAARGQSLRGTPRVVDSGAHPHARGGTAAVASARARETFCEARYQLLRSAQGRALALGYRLPRQWRRPRVLPKVLPELPPNLAQLLERTGEIARAMKQQLDAVEAEIKCDTPPSPVGVGALTAGVLDREVMDWCRIKRARRRGALPDCRRRSTRPVNASNWARSTNMAIPGCASAEKLDRSQHARFTPETGSADSTPPRQQFAQALSRSSNPVLHRLRRGSNRSSNFGVRHLFIFR